MTQVVDRTFQTKIRIMESSLQAPKQTPKKIINFPYSRVYLFGRKEGYDNSKWNYEDILIFQVVYSVNGGPEIIEDFKLEKYSYRGIRWPA